jgi:hypothetical protein
MTTPWRNDPDLAGKLHPQSPDDVQVLVHDGEPRRTQRNPEGCWVKITGTAGVLRSPIMPKGPPGPAIASQLTWLERTIYQGQLLNQPHQLSTVSQGATVRFVHAPGIPNPLMITPAYEQERPRWAFTPCDRCGADQALDAPSVMAKTRFPDAPPGAVPVAFSAFCPCGGTMMLAQVEGAPMPSTSMPPSSPSMRPQGAFGATGPTGGSFAPPANAPVQPAGPSNDNTGRVLLFSALGCVGLVSMCCLSGVGGAFYTRSGYADVGRVHAETFLGHVQRRDWAAALAAAEYQGAYAYSSETPSSFGACLTATPLFEMTSFECPSASGEWPLDNGAEATCNVTTPRGTTEITITVNSTDGAPYLGYVWFSPDATLGPEWHGDNCARWSGRDYYMDPPSGRVRP